MNNATPHSKMAARAHRKGFKPLPANGWSPEWGPWEDYVERCVHEGAQVKNDEFGVYIEWLNGSGNPHREDGPAQEYSDGSKVWWVNGRQHREDGPAVERPDGYKAWCVNGLLHRLDGPAKVLADGTVAFYKDGIKYTDITFTQRF